MVGISIKRDWVGWRSRDVSERADKAEGQERLTVRYTYLSWAASSYVCMCVCGCVTYAASRVLMQTNGLPKNLSRMSNMHIGMLSGR